MSFWANLFKTEQAPTSRKTAADRLKVVNRYVRGVNTHDIHMTIRSEDNIEMLEMNINLPEDQPT
ncbi:MAG: cell division topological specificity factor MinE [Aquirhabdus sp.]